MQTRIFLLSSLLFLSVNSFTQSDRLKTDYKFSVSAPWLTFANWEKEERNIHHYEFHFKYRLTLKDKIGIKFATWKIYEPLGIPLWD